MLYKNICLYFEIYTAFNCPNSNTVGIESKVLEAGPQIDEQDSEKQLWAYINNFQCKSSLCEVNLKWALKGLKTWEFSDFENVPQHNKILGTVVHIHVSAAGIWANVNFPLALNNLKGE